MMSKFENEATDHCVLNAKSKIRLKINFKKTKKKKPNCSYRVTGIGHFKGNDMVTELVQSCV